MTQIGNALLPADLSNVPTWISWAGRTWRTQRDAEDLMGGAGRGGRAAV